MQSMPVPLPDRPAACAMLTAPQGAPECCCPGGAHQDLADNVLSAHQRRMHQPAATATSCSWTQGPPAYRELARCTGTLECPEDSTLLSTSSESTASTESMNTCRGTPCVGHSPGATDANVPGGAERAPCPGVSCTPTPACGSNPARPCGTAAVCQPCSAGRAARVLRRAGAALLCAARCGSAHGAQQCAPAEQPVGLDWPGRLTPCLATGSAPLATELIVQLLCPDGQLCHSALPPLLLVPGPAHVHVRRFRLEGAPECRATLSPRGRRRTQARPLGRNGGHRHALGQAPEAAGGAQSGTAARPDGGAGRRAQRQGGHCLWPDRVPTVPAGPG